MEKKTTEEENEMATLHFINNPYKRSVFGIAEETIKGRFAGWQLNAEYKTHMTVVLTVNTTNVTLCEHKAAPNLRFLSDNRAIINAYKAWGFKGSFAAYQEAYATEEEALSNEIQALLKKLNACRKQAKKSATWYIDFHLNERAIAVFEGKL